MNRLRVFTKFCREPRGKDAVNSRQDGNDYRWNKSLITFHQEQSLRGRTNKCVGGANSDQWLISGNNAQQ